MIKSKYIVYDTETGGLDCTKNPITQYACVVLDFKTLKEVDRFETFVKPYNDLIIEKQALEHTMVTMSDIRSGITLKDFTDVLFEFNALHQAKGKFKGQNRLVPVGHNIPFDNRFLTYACNLVKKNYYEYIHENFIDTYPLAKMTWGLAGDEKLTLTACTEYAKIKLTDAHGAMNDVEATADLFRWFVKKLRAKRGTADSAEQESRARGQEFFEFKCGVK
jgi:DNA polymerase III alpha subunit (gram-positive type)